MKRAFCQSLRRALLAFCLLAQLGAPALGLAQPCAMSADGDHAAAMAAEGGAMAAMDAGDCCEDEGSCLMAHCMAPVGACAAEPIPLRLPLAGVDPAPSAPIPPALPRQHFRPPIPA
ncbi:MAG TPA: hypothetical protein VJ947_05365 [Pseudohaliea sp.]|nr:hypothetical protein [Pseudohaliea sp.]